jgi:putative endopeptidase
MSVSRWPLLRALVLALVVAVLTLSPVTSVLATQILPGHGIDPANMDLSVDPSVDFYHYANGGWLDHTPIPPDFPGIDTLSSLEGHTRAQLVDLLQREAAHGNVAPGSDEWKAIRLYAQGTDLTTRNAQGVEPIQPILREIDAIDTLAEFHRFLQTSVFSSIPGLFSVNAGPDMKDSATTVAYLNGPTLGLGTRDYYLDDDASLDGVRRDYVTTAAALLRFAGDDAAQARDDAQAVYDFEVALAKPLLSREESQDFSVVYNPTTPAELAARYPLMDWQRYLDELGLADVSTLIVTEPRYLDALSGIVNETPLPVLKDFLALQLLWTSSANLSETVESTAFQFYGTTLNGLQVQAPIEGRTLDQVSYFLGDAVGKLYVDNYFSPVAKARGEGMVRELVSAFRLRLEHNTWMTVETKANALAKLDRLQIKVGYPNHWHDYADVEITDSYFGSALSAFNANYREGLAKIGKPVDKSEWPFPPQTVNAMYNPLNNEIIIPAAILQPPFFDAAADPASNFGSLGFVIGHEITHGFDLRGSQFDGEGNLANWWTDRDRAQFQALNDRLIDQYSQISVLNGHAVDGQLTLVENVADLGGIQVAYDALEAHLAKYGRPVPAAGDTLKLTQEQRFFVAAASVWRANVRDDALLTQLQSDEHSPAMVRATQPLRNCDAFYDAFDIGPGDPMYLPPAERIVIW